MGRLLRAITDSSPRANTESYTVKEALSAGEMVPEKAINNILDANIRQLMDRKGVLIDGFPRNLQQVKHFENKVGFEIVTKIERQLTNGSTQEFLNILIVIIICSLSKHSFNFSSLVQATTANRAA